MLEPRRRIDQALHAVIMEAYVSGVSTRSIDDLVGVMGVQAGISRSEVSRICAGLDERVGAFRNRTLGHVGFPYAFLDATHVHVRNDALGQVVSRGSRARRRRMCGDPYPQAHGRVGPREAPWPGAVPPGRRVPSAWQPHCRTAALSRAVDQVCGEVVDGCSDAAVVEMASRARGRDGHLITIFNFGTFGFFGSTGGMALHSPVVGMATRSPQRLLLSWRADWSG